MALTETKSLWTRPMALVGLGALLLASCGKSSEDKKLKFTPPPPNAAAAPAEIAVSAPASSSAGPVTVGDLSGLDINQVNDMALAAEKNGEKAKAEQLRIAAVEKAKAIQPWNHLYPDTLRTLGFFYHYQGDAANAEKTFLELIKLSEEMHGAEDSGVADAIIHLTSVYNIQGKFEFSEPLYLRAAAIREKVYGPDSEQVAQVLGYHAGCLRNMNRIEEADKLDARIQEMKARRAKGESAPAKPEKASK